MPASLTSTTLSAAVTTSAYNEIRVTSATGFVAGYGLYIDREFMTITSVNGTIIGVRRGDKGTRATPHASGATVYCAPKTQFTTYDRAGAGTFADEVVQPWINILTGEIFTVIGGIWVKTNVFQTANSYGLSPAIWNDCPLAQMGVDPAFGSVVGDDFLGPMIVTTAHNYVWTGTNGAVTHVANVPHGEIILTATGADKDDCYMTDGNNIRGCIKADAASTWWFETRIKINQIATSQGVFVGLYQEAALADNLIADDTVVLSVNDGLGFQIITPGDTAAIWQTIYMINAGARVAANATAGTATTAFTKLGMKSVAGTLTYYIDGVAISGTVLSSATNYPLDQVMQCTWMTKCGSGVANTLTIDWYKAAQTRLAN